MKPLIHATISAKKYGGVPEDYQEVHDFFDTSKSTIGDVRHRAILHNTFGIFLCEKLHGIYITNSEGKKVSVRDIAEDHVMDDLGFIPTVEHWVGEMPIREWMSGTVKKTKIIPFSETEVFFDKAPHPKQGENPDAATRYRKNLKNLGKDSD